MLKQKSKGFESSGDTDSESKRLAVGGGGGTLTKVSQSTSHVI